MRISVGILKNSNACIERVNILVYIIGRDFKPDANVNKNGLSRRITNINIGFKLPIDPV